MRGILPRSVTDHKIAKAIFLRELLKTKYFLCESSTELLGALSVLCARLKFLCVYP